MKDSFTTETQRHGGCAGVWLISLLAMLLVGCAGDGPSAGGPIATPLEPGPVAMRRLTETQYRATVDDVLGEGLSIAGRLEPDNRRAGLLAVGSSFVSVTAAGFEQYDAIARVLAEQALAPERRAQLVGCAPPDPQSADDACAAAFVRAVGRRLWRRPLDDAEVASRVAIAGDAADSLGDFYGGLQAALSSLLVAPEFLFRIEHTEASDGEYARLTSLSMATRLSYFLWNSTPDDELLAAAERGELTDDAGLAAQVDRMLASPRLEDSVRAYFGDRFSFDEIEQGLVRKDPMLFPAFSQELIDDAREQTLRVVTAHLLEADGDYRDLFTTRQSFMTRALGIVYRVPVPSPDEWEAFEFPSGGERGGVMTHISLLALHSHPGRSSPTLRGKFVREVLLCQDVPPPPGDIDFSAFADDSSEDRRTARKRLTIHVENETCAGCHKIMDPIGLALEQLDGIGAFRETENGEVIDPSGELDGATFDNAVDLGRALSRHPNLGPCLVRTLYMYAVGRDPVAGEEGFLTTLDADAASGGYRIRDLMRAIAVSDAFRLASGAREAEIPTPTAMPEYTSTPTPTEPTPDGTPRTPTPTRPPAPPTSTPRAATLAEIQADIFTPQCATQFCHSQQVRAGGLVLEAGQAHANLVGIASSNPTAQQAGLLRVEAGDPDGSFLMMKVIGPTEVAFGSRMPLGGTALGAADIAALRSWIAAGATP